MVRVAVLVGHPGENPEPLQFALPQLPRRGEYIRPPVPRHSGDGDELWRVVRIIHEQSGSGVDATVYVEPADEMAILDEFDNSSGE